jgi:hypothetical protein
MSPSSYGYELHLPRLRVGTLQPDRHVASGLGAVTREAAPHRGVAQLDELLVDDDRVEALTLAARQQDGLDEIDHPALDRTGTVIRRRHRLR